MPQRFAPKLAILLVPLPSGSNKSGVKLTINLVECHHAELSTLFTHSVCVHYNGRPFSQQSADMAVH